MAIPPRSSSSSERSTSSALEVREDWQDAALVARAAIRVWPALAGFEKVEAPTETKREWMDAICRLPILKLVRVSAEHQQALRLGRLASDARSAASVAYAAAADAYADAYADARSAAYAAATAASASASVAATASASAIAYDSVSAAYTLTQMSFEEDRKLIARTHELSAFFRRPLWKGTPARWGDVVARWKTVLSNLGLSSLGDRYDRAMMEGIDLDEWIAWALDLPEPKQPKFIITSHKANEIKISPLPAPPLALAHHVHRQTLAHPSSLAPMLASTPILGHDEASLKALITPESKLPKLQPHMQPSPLWLAWMEMGQAERVREVWDRVRRATEGLEIPAS